MKYLLPMLLIVLAVSPVAAQESAEDSERDRRARAHLAEATEVREVQEADNRRINRALQEIYRSLDGTIAEIEETEARLDDQADDIESADERIEGAGANLAGAPTVGEIAGDVVGAVTDPAVLLTLLFGGGALANRKKLGALARMGADAAKGVRTAPRGDEHDPMEKIREGVGELRRRKKLREVEDRADSSFGELEKILGSAADTHGNGSNGNGRRSGRLQQVGGE